MSKTVPFKKRFNLAKVYNLFLFDPSIGPYQVLPILDRVDLGVKAMTGYSAFPKDLALLEHHHQIV